MNVKQMTANQVLLRCLGISVISGIILNQLLLNYFCSRYLGSIFFDRIYWPFTIYKLSYFFIVHNDSFRSVVFGIAFGAGEAIIIGTILGGFIVGIFFALFIYRAVAKKDLSSARYGTATWEKPDIVVQSDKVDPPDSVDSYEKYGRYGIFIGTLQHNQGTIVKWVNDDKTITEIKLTELAHFGSQHVFMFAPTGSGKGVGVVIPTLVSYPHSVFVYDLKGENHIATSGYRNKVFNNVIIKFEPSCPDGSSARYNPLEEIRIGTVYETSDAQKLALALIDQDGKGLEDHWKRMAFDLLTGVILHVSYTKKNRNLNAIALFMSGIEPDTKENYENEKAWLSEMAGRTQPFIHRNGYAQLMGISIEDAMLHLQSVNLVDEKGLNVTIKASAANLVNKDGKAEGERSSIISTATGSLSLYKDPIVAMNTAVSDFKLDDLQNFTQPVSFYFKVPNDQRDRLKPLVRLLITQTINSIQASQEGKMREILFVLDEFPELNKIEIMESALATIRGYKVRMLLIAQDYLQLIKYYGESQTIFSNCGIRLAYAPNEIKTAEMLSKYTGTTTYVAETTSTTMNRQPFQITQSGSSVTVNNQETSRPLMTAGEITQFGDDMIILIEKNKPIRGHKFAWFASQKFKEMIYDISNSNNSGNKYKPVIKSHRIVRNQPK